MFLGIQPHPTDAKVDSRCQSCISGLHRVLRVSTANGIARVALRTGISTSSTCTNDPLTKRGSTLEPSQSDDGNIQQDRLAEKQPKSNAVSSEQEEVEEEEEEQ